MKRVVAARLGAFRLRAFKRGVLGGDNRWLALWGALAAARLVRKVTKPKPEVARLSLAPGQRVLITHFATTDAESETPTLLS